MLIEDFIVFDSELDIVCIVTPSQFVFENISDLKWLEVFWWITEMSYLCILMW